MGASESKQAEPIQVSVSFSTYMEVQPTSTSKPKFRIPEEPKAKPKFRIPEAAEERTSYGPEEVARMNDYTLCAEFIRLTGRQTLSCSHCKGERPILTNWMASIRKRCMKREGLSATTKLPKTCDEQQARNMVCNPVNNPAYTKLRSEAVDNDEKKEIIKERQEKLQKVGLQARPYRYI